MARHQGKTAGQGRPIARHPLFPVIAALWGTALFFVLAIAIGPGPLAGLLSALHIDRLVPQAAPPFGQTARLLFALALGAVGGVTGLILARRLGTDDAARDARREAAVIRKQDARALREEADPQDDLAAFEPVMAPPAGPPPVLDVAGFAAAHATLPPLVDESESAGEVLLTQEVLPALPAPTIGAAARRIVSADLATLSELELMERLALALDRWRAMGGASPAVPPPAALLRAAGPGPEPTMGVPTLAPVPAARPTDAPAAVEPPLARDQAGATPPDPAATEAALRDALASLRRMSGAA